MVVKLGVLGISAIIGEQTLESFQQERICNWITK